MVARTSQNDGRLQADLCRWRARWPPLAAAGSTGACLSAEARSTGGRPMTPRWLLWPCLVLLAAIIPPPAQDWPSKTVTVVVPFPPAGSTGLLARIAAEAGEQRMGKPFVVENRPGAGQ